MMRTTLVTAAVVVTVAGALLAAACSSNVFGACGTGATLATHYACEGNTQVVTQEQCTPKAPTVTRRDCAAEGGLCLQMASIGGESRFSCAVPCKTTADCPVDTHCGGGPGMTADGGSTCMPSLREGFACDPSAPCVSGLVCAFKVDGGRDGSALDAGDGSIPAECKPYEYNCICQKP